MVCRVSELHFETQSDVIQNYEKPVPLLHETNLMKWSPLNDPVLEAFDSRNAGWLGLMKDHDDSNRVLQGQTSGSSVLQMLAKFILA